jgi:hypothetical protein
MAVGLVGLEGGFELAKKYDTDISVWPIELLFSFL